MGDERRFDLERGHPHAVDLEHVIGAPAVIIVAVRVAQVLVAGMGPFADEGAPALRALVPVAFAGGGPAHHEFADLAIDRKSTRLNSSHLGISYAVFCLKKKIRKKKQDNSIKDRH